MSAVVLDASALLALLFDEPGAEVVEKALEGAARISAVNWCEVVGKLVEKGEGRDGARLDQLLDRLTAVVEVVDFGAEGAETAAALLPQTRRHGLSLADRACLSLGLREGAPVLTADRAWSEPGVDVDVRPIR